MLQSNNNISNSIEQNNTLSITSQILYDKNNIILGYKFASIPQHLLLTLQSSTELLVKFQKPSKYDTKRGGYAYNMGYWNGSSPHIYPSRDFRVFWAQYWVALNFPLWILLSNLLAQYFPSIYLKNFTAHIPFLFGSWGMIALNTFAAKSHIDSKDDFNGICCIVTFGNFSGGDLYFPSEKLSVACKNGTIIMFHSAKYTHYVKKFKGNRKSVILYMPHSLLH